MAGEPFYLPNYGPTNQGGFNLGFGYPTQGFQLPNWNAPGAMSLTGALTPDQLRLNTLNQQMAPNPTMGYIGAGIQGINTLGNLWLGFQSLRQAQEDAKWQRGMAEKNYANSVLSYNTAVEDRIRSRYDAPTQAANADAIQAEINKRKIGG